MNIDKQDLRNILTKINQNLISAWEYDLESTTEAVAIQDHNFDEEKDTLIYNNWLDDLTMLADYTNEELQEAKNKVNQLLFMSIDGEYGHEIDLTPNFCLYHYAELKHIVLAYKNGDEWQELYVDYLKMLRYHGFDIKNPFYICPTNLKQEHDRLVAKKDKIDAIERIIKNENYQKTYEKYMKKFFGLKLQKGNLVIEPLRTVEEFYQEGAELNHCVYKSSFYEEPHKLVLSAKIDGKRTETILYNLNTRKLVYSLGQQNKKSKHNKAIVSLLKSKESEILKLVG